MSITTPILLKVSTRNSNELEILEGIKAVKSETTDDAITYAFEFSFKDNANHLRIHVGVNLMVLTITFDSDDKEQFNWAKNSGNNNYGMNISKLNHYESEKEMDLISISNAKNSSFFEPKIPSVLTVTQKNKIKGKIIETIILKEPVVNNCYSISIEMKEEGFLSAIFNEKRLCIYADKINTELEIREIPCLSTGFIYLPKNK